MGTTADLRDELFRLRGVVNPVISGGDRRQQDRKEARPLPSSSA